MGSTSSLFSFFDIEVNPWLLKTLNKKEYQIRFSKYKKYFEEKEIEKKYSEYHDFLKKYHKLIESHDTTLKTFSKIIPYELVLLNHFEEYINIFKVFFINESQYHINKQHWIVKFNYKNSKNQLNKQSLLMIDKFFILENEFIQYYKKNKQSILIDSKKFVDETNEILNQCYYMALVYNLLKDENNPIFIKNLNTVAKGAEIVQFKTNENSRNFLFELVVNSFFKHCGWEIKFSKSDVVAQKNNITVVSECKKITSKTNFKSELEIAAKQLKRIDINNSKNTFGMIFIDITNILFENIEKFMKLFSFNTEQAGMNLIKNLTNDFLDDNSFVINSINDKYVDTSLGVCFFCGMNLPISLYKTCFAINFHFMSSGKLDDERFDFYSKICSPFEGVFNPTLEKLNKYA